MKIYILDYNDDKTDVELDLDNILRIEMMVISGDEILTIVHKDGTTDRIDSSSDRCTDYYDEDYIVYDPVTDTNLLEDENWLNRKTSYDY